MNRLLAATAAFAFGAAAGFAVAVQAADEPPPWAYGFEGLSNSTTLYTLPGSKHSFTQSQIINRYGPADWFPEDHPIMPEIVAHGRESAVPTVWACSLCHYPNGKGRPENANITGLSYEYFVRQLIDFRDGARQTSDQRKFNTDLMAGFARAMTDEEITAAAKYFTSIPATPWITVVERETAPKTKAAGGMLLTREGAEADVESIGERIIETPVNVRDTDLLRSPRSGFIAYVPPGSLKKGEALVMNGVTAGGERVIACAICHGPDLRGLGPVPILAGRSPSYIVRQLYDMQHGKRNGVWTPLMIPVIASLGPADLLAAAAYLASLRP
jgi:cytochrome c553